MHLFQKLFSYRSISILAFLLTLSSFANANPNLGLEFPIWLNERAESYLTNLKKQSASLTEQDIQRSEQLVREAKQKEQWSPAAIELSRIMGKRPENREGWLDLALVQQKLRQVEPNNYQAQEEGRYAAILAYRLSKDPKEKTEALLLFGNSLDPEALYDSPSYKEVWDAVVALGQLKEIRNANSRFAKLMPFQFSKVDVNTENIPPSACFSFTQPLNSQNVRYEDYFSITPKIDGALKVQGRQLCFSPVKFGATYDIVFKPGMPSLNEDKLEREVRLSTKIKDQGSRLSFSPRAYILMREDSPKIPLTSVNVERAKVKLLKINDRAFNQLAGNGSINFLEQLWGNYSVEQIANFTGELLYEGELVLANSKNTTQTQQIPLDAMIKEFKPGVYVVFVEETGSVFGDRARATQWVVITDIGMVSFKEENGGILVNVRSLKTAEALSGMELQLISYNNTILAKTKTDEQGNGYFDASKVGGSGGNRPLWILAYSQKGDFSMLDFKQPGFDLSDRGVAGRKALGPQEAFLYAEQGVYRPGDKIHVNALLRDSQSQAVGKLPLTFVLQRPDEVEVSKFTLIGNEQGFYEKEIALQPTARTGQWTLLAYLDPKKPPIGRLNFSVEDFVPSRVLVKVNTNKPQIKMKEPLQVQVVAQYLFGAKASGLTGDVSLTLKKDPNPFPQFQAYEFGLVQDEFTDLRTQYALPALNAEGESQLEILLETLPKTTKPLIANIRATLMDAGGRPEIGSVKIPVVTTPWMVGVKPLFADHTLNDAISEAVFEIITLDLKAKLLATQGLEYELYREQIRYAWYQPNPGQAWEYQQQIEDNFMTKGVVNTQVENPSRLTLQVKDWGQYRLEIRDPKTGAATSVRFTKGWMEISSNAESPDRLKVRMEARQVKPGESVAISVESPFKGQAMLVVANDTVLETRNLSLNEGSNTFKIKAKENWGLGAYILITAMRPLESQTGFFFKRKASEDKPYLPKRAIGLAWLPLDPSSKTLDIKLQIPEKVRPLTEVELGLEIRYPDTGRLANDAYVTLAAVDEGILKLTDFATPNPAQFFLSQRQLGITIRDYYGKLIDPLKGPLAELRSGGDQAALSRNMQALSKRSFKVVSLYLGLVPLDNGKGKVKLKLPNFNGTLRLMAIAFNDKRVGSQSAELLIRDPVVLEGILPRFMAPGDLSQFTVLLHNVESVEDQFEFSVSAEGEVLVQDKPEPRITLKPGENRTINLIIRANQSGNGKITAVLKGKEGQYKTEHEITIRDPRSYSQVRDYHLIKPGETVNIEPSLWQGFVSGSVRGILSLSSQIPWNVRAIQENLALYPYRCVEQIVSRAYAFLLFQKLNEMDAKGTQNEIQNILAVLTEKQLANGAFSLWSSQEGDHWLTAYVLDFMLRAKSRGIEVPAFSLDRGFEWLTQKISSQQTDDYSLMGTAYGIYVLTKADRIESGSIRYFFDTFFDQLKSPAARAMVGVALVTRGDLERAQQAFQKLYSEDNELKIDMLSPYGSLLSEKVSVLAMLYEAQNVSKLLALGPRIESLQQSIAVELKKTMFRSTQDQAWLLLAAANLENATETKPTSESKPSFSAKVNQQSLSSQNGLITTDFNEAALDKAITIVNISDKPLWQSLEISGLPIEWSAKNQGIEIQKNYYSLAGQALTLEQLPQGEQFIVVLSGKALDEMPSQLVVNDLLSAGVSIENPRLGQGEEVANLSWLGKISKPDFYEPRDDRFLAFITLDENTRQFKLAYTARAITPGRYTLPGLFVEDMYAPQYFARTASSVLEIKAP